MAIFWPRLISPYIILDFYGFNPIKLPQCCLPYGIHPSDPPHYGVFSFCPSDPLGSTFNTGFDISYIVLSKHQMIVLVT